MAETTTERAVFAGVDTSQPFLGAARWAAQEAVRRGLPLWLVHACVFDTGMAASADDEASLERWYRSIDDVARTARITAAEVTADLVVLGSHGLGGLRDFWSARSRSKWRSARHAPWSSCAAKHPNVVVPS